MSKEKKPNRDAALADLETFAIELALGPSDPTLNPFNALNAFSNIDEGGFMLNGDEGKRYQRIVAELRKAMGERMSKGSITKLVQTVILKTADQKKKNQSTPIEQRAKEAAKAARRELLAPNLEWVSCIPILGFMPPKKAWKVGDVTFIDINRAEGKKLMRKARYITSTTQHPKAFKMASNAQIKRDLIDDHEGQAFALVRTLALEAEAAWKTAKRRLRDTLACFNFAHDAMYGASPQYELTDDEPRKRHYRSGLTLNVTDHTYVVSRSEVMAASREMPPEKFRADMRCNRALRHLLEYLQSPTLTKHQKRVLSALQWAGRAAVELKPEEAFLFRAIALESLILSGGENSGLTERLAYSTVHLLGQWLKDRQESFRHIKRLYGVRSSIVHTGKLEVDEDDASLMRKYVSICFSRMLSEKTFLNMKGEKELDDWFRARMRGDK